MNNKIANRPFPEYRLQDRINEAMVALRLGADPAALLKIYTVKIVAQACQELYDLLSLGCRCVYDPSIEKRCTRHCCYYDGCKIGVMAMVLQGRGRGCGNNA